jgi:DNA-binding transcriptional regulator LsrR (DeoR family)
MNWEQHRLIKKESLEMMYKNMTKQQIANIIGLPKSIINRLLQDYNLRKYKKRNKN